MAVFILRRMVAAFFIVLGATFIAYLLMANAGDPLTNARGIPNPVQREQTVASVTATLHLDVNPVARYFIWLKGVLGCFVGKCDFGQTIDQQSVTTMLSTALGSSLKLITASTLLAVSIGITIGVISALRQYSGLDYTVTFLAFLFFALPVFFIGVILKDLLALRFNTFLQAGAYFSWAFIIIFSAVMGLIGYSLVPGERRRRLGIGAAVFVVFFAALYYVTVSQWLLDPRLGIVVVAILSVLAGLGVTVLTAGLANKKALYTSMTTVAVGVALYYPLQYFFYENMNWLRLFGLLIVAIAVGIGVGYAFGGDDKGLSARTGALTAVATSFFIFVDRMMQAWQTYMNNPAIGGRPIRTTLPATPNIKGDFWIITTDTFTHLILPTITLMLISLATHSRFARASMLEVMNQDYIRTARSKGQSQRTVVMRHAFRNALIPMATVVAFDIAALIGGAVLTERIFGWRSMGAMFSDGLTKADPNPVMAFFVVGAVIAVLANLLADIAYAGLDPTNQVDLMTIHMPSDPHETDALPVGPRDETSLEQREVAGLSQGQIVRKRFFRHKGAMISLFMLVFILVLSVSSIGWGPIPGWWKHNYYEIVAPPGGSRATFSFLWIGGSFFHWGDFPFGAPSVGYDNFSQVMRGIQQTLVIVLIMGILSTVIGVVTGALAGYYRGRVDSVIMRFTDLMITLPILLVTAVLGFVLGAHGVIALAVALGLLSWQAMTRLVRAEFLTLREREFVDAARVAGASDRRIIFKHILPNTVGVIVVQATLTISGGILAEAALGFLGFGIQQPDVSLGSLISQYQGAMLTGEPYLFLWPSIFIILIVLSLNFIGDGLRDAFDPRQKRIPKAKDLRASRAEAQLADLRAEGSADIGEY